MDLSLLLTIEVFLHTVCFFTYGGGSVSKKPDPISGRGGGQPEVQKTKPNSTANKENPNRISTASEKRPSQFNRNQQRPTVKKKT